MVGEIRTNPMALHPRRPPKPSHSDIRVGTSVSSTTSPRSFAKTPTTWCDPRVSGRSTSKPTSMVAHCVIYAPYILHPSSS